MATLTLVAVPAVLSGGRAEAATRTDGMLTVAVIGDSYSAGTGAAPFFDAKDNPTGRSARNYAGQFAEQVKVALPEQKVTVRNLAVHGARIDPGTTGAARIGDQAKELHPDAETDLVLVTAGGNDVSFSTIVSSCAVRLDVSGCRSAISSARAQVASGEIGSRIEGLLREVRAQVQPDTTIALLGYPHLERDEQVVVSRCSFTGNIGDIEDIVGPCPRFVSVEIDRFEFGKELRSLQELADTEQAKAVAALGDRNVVFVPVASAFAGRELSITGNNDDRMMTTLADVGVVGVLYRRYENIYHPNEAGYSAIAGVLFADPRIPKSDPQARPTQLLVDVSGSMGEAGKLDRARSALREAVASAGAGDVLGLMSFSGSCTSRATELVPLGVENRAELASRIDGLAAGGGTPMAPALEQARAKLAGLGGGRVVLVADGQNDCGDVCGAVRSAATSWVGTRVLTVGYGVPDGGDAEHELRCVADATGGNYAAAPDGAALTKVLRNSITDQPAQQNAEPVDVRVRAGQTSIDVSWVLAGDPATVAQVTVNWGVNGRFIARKVLTPSQTSSTITGLLPGTIYEIDVVADARDGTFRKAPTVVARTTT